MRRVLKLQLGYSKVKLQILIYVTLKINSNVIAKVEMFLHQQINHEDNDIKTLCEELI